jgi:hypothetical protein
MPMPQELLFDLPQLGPHPLRDRDPAQPEPPVPGLPADMREAEEIERLWLAEPACLPPPGGVPPELDQARLARVQFQGELRKPLAKVRQEPLRVALMLKARDEESRRGESHPPPLAEPDLNLSAHPAPIVQPSGLRPIRQ